MIMKRPSELDVIERARERVLQLYPSKPPIGLPKKSPANSTASRDEVLLLVCLFKSTFITGVARAGLIGWSVAKVSRLLAGMEAKKWLVPWYFSFSPRGFVKYYNITVDGLKAAGLSMPDEGSGSFMHRQSQLHIRDQFKNQGFQARIEFVLNRIRADVGVRFNDKVLAVEVGISSPENEFNNIKQDYAAGFDEVLVLVRDSNMIRRLNEIIKEKAFKAPKSLRIELLTTHLQRPTCPTIED